MTEPISVESIRRNAKGQFLPGQNSSRGKGGRRKSEFLLQDILDERIPKEKWGEIIDAQVVKALSGDTAAAKFLVERRFGEPVNPGERDAADRFFAFLAAVRKP